jgi:SHS2 domain-containing protein
MFRFHDHMGEVRLYVEAPSLGELFAEAGRAVADVLAGDLPRGEAVPSVVLELGAKDLERLLVDGIDELVFRSEVGHLVLDQFDVEVARGRLRARVAGHRLAAVRTAIKAATLHELQVRPIGTGWCASVVLDV